MLIPIKEEINKTSEEGIFNKNKSALYLLEGGLTHEEVSICWETWRNLELVIVHEASIYNGNERLVLAKRIKNTTRTYQSKKKKNKINKSILFLFFWGTNVFLTCVRNDQIRISDIAC